MSGCRGTRCTRAPIIAHQCCTTHTSKYGIIIIKAKWKVKKASTLKPISGLSLGASANQWVTMDNCESMGGWQSIWVNVATCWSKDALARNCVTDQQEEGIILLSHTTQKNDAKRISKKKSTAYSKSLSYPISAASPAFACTDTSGNDAAVCRQRS